MPIIPNIGGTAATVISTAAQDAYTLAFEISPIFLVGGIATGVPGGVLPIVLLGSSLAGVTQGVLLGSGLNFESFFARYIPIPGGNIINQSFARVPFANQSVASNAVIREPLTISLLMYAPVKDTAGYLSKLALYTSLATSLETHNNLGGMYHVLTPAKFYRNCLMTAMTDITGAETNQKQIEWQLDFFQPLLTQSSATNAVGGLMKKLAGGSPVTSPNWSGILGI